jgi:hypothetical protein
MQITNPVDAEPDTAPDGPPEDLAPAGLSVLDRVRAHAKLARETRHFDLPLSHVGEGVGIRLALPTDGASVVINGLGESVGVEADLEYLSHAIVGVSELADDGWQPVDGLTVQELAVTYGEVLRGVSPVLDDPKDCVAELFREGTPPVINASWVSWAAASYRAWAMSDPTGGR